MTTSSALKKTLTDVDTIYSRLDHDDIVTGIYVNLCKEIDTVHDMLLYKLYYYGVRGSVFCWFEDYLTNRRQFFSVSAVKFNN